MPTLAEAAFEQGRFCQRKRYALKRVINTLKRVINTLKRVINTLKRVINTLKRVINTLKRVINMLKRVINTLKRVINTLKTVINTLKRVNMLKRAVVCTSMSSYVHLRSLSLLAEAAYQQGCLAVCCSVL